MAVCQGEPPSQPCSQRSAPILVALAEGQDFFGIWQPPGGTMAAVKQRIDEISPHGTGSIVRMFEEDGDIIPTTIQGWLGDTQNASENATGCKHRVVIAGHSHGGDAARKAAGYYTSNAPGRSVELLFLFDAIGKPWHSVDSLHNVSPHVHSAVAWYQRTDAQLPALPFWMRGYRFNAPGLNMLFQDNTSPGFAHSTITDTNSAATDDFVGRLRSMGSTMTD